MIKKNKLYTALISAGLLLGSAATYAAPFGNFEGPVDGEVVTGVVNVWGWASDTSGYEIDTVELFVDNEIDGRRLGMGTERRDVENAFPGQANARYSGFSGALLTRNLTNGPHTLTIQVTNEFGEQLAFTKQVIVSNTPDEGVVFDQVDLGEATARVSGNKIFLDGAAVNGQTYDNLELSYDAQSNGFKVTAFKDDLNHDGYADDDLNQDGFHDDDHDKDGYHDDDLDQDGFHDDDHGSDDNGSDDNGSDDNGSDDNGSDDEGSDDGLNS